MNNERTARAPGWRVALSIAGAVAIICCGLFNAVAPSRQGTFHGARISASEVVSVRPGSQWDRAGVRPGDRLSGGNLLLLNNARAGAVYPLEVTRAGKTFTAFVKAEPVTDLPGGRIADFFVELSCCIFGIIVLLRARRDDLAGTLCGYTMWVGATVAAADFIVTAATANASFLLNGVAQAVCAAIQTYFLFRLIGVFPPENMPVQRLAVRIAPVMALTASLWLVASLFNINWLYGVDVGASAIGFVMLLWVVLHAAPAHRARVRWFASTLLLVQFCSLVQAGLIFIPAMPVVVPQILFYVTNLGPVGPIYATLRHRVVDLDVVISRSAIYAGVSIFIVGLFIGAEWLAQRIADQFAADAARGLTVQMVSFGVALAVGLSVRHVHGAIERRINGVFFSARTRRLESLKRFAYEADISDTREGLLNLTYETLSRCIETRSVAVYVARGDGFLLSRTSDVTAPESVDKNDRLVLHLLRWPQTFAFDDQGALHGRLIVPLMLRTNVVGFLALGGKEDHTRYLPDEIAALETLSHHVATSYAFISSNLDRLHAVRAAEAG